MLTRKTVLVLGAGASAGYGFPVGEGLKRLILRMNPGSREVSGIFDAARLREFIRCFDESQRDSIDAFLAHRGEFSDIGKKAISYVLLGYEQGIPRAREIGEKRVLDDWYRLFFNRITKVAWDDLDFSLISIVNFNYDRSLECYLISALKAAYGKSDDEVLRKMQSLEIIHVYGSLGGRLIHSGMDFLTYSVGVSPQSVDIAARSLRVIPEQRSNDDPVLLRAQEFLSNADSICFLGFSFDQVNLSRLRAANTCASNSRKKNIYASCFGLTAVEAADAAKQCGLIMLERDHMRMVTNPGNLVGWSASGFPEGFMPMRCYDTLRETPALS